MKVVRLLLLACASFLLLACSQQELIDKLTPKTESAYAQKLFAELRAGHYDTVKATLAPSLRNAADIDQNLAAVGKLFPAGQPKSVKVVGANTSSMILNGGPTTTKYSLAYEYEYADSWILANMVLERKEGQLQVLGFHAQSLTRSLEQMSAFSLADKDGAQWIFLALVIAIPFFCVYAFVLCLRTPKLERKWLWALFTLVGVFSLGMNWSNGEVGFRLLSVQLLSASAIQSGYSPWLMSISFPVGAVWFLYKRQAMRREAEAEAALAEP